MKRFVLVVVCSSVLWGSAFGASAKSGHGSAKAIQADVANLVKARAAESASRSANGDSAKQASAAKSNLVKARAVKAAKRVKLV
jgi:hypothetical protein